MIYFEKKVFTIHNSVWWDLLKTKSYFIRRKKIVVTFFKDFPLKPNLSFITKNQNLNLLKLQKPNQV